MYYAKKVYLSEYKKDELEEVVDFLNDWDVQSSLNPGLISPLTYEDEIEWFDKNRKDREKSHSFAIRTIKDNVFIGGCGYHDVCHKNRSCYVGIMVSNKEYQSQGLGSEAFGILTNYLFKEMNIRKIMLKVFGTNKKAIHVYEKLGFEIEGTLKDHIYREGRYIDEIIMAKFKK